MDSLTDEDAPRRFSWTRELSDPWLLFPVTGLLIVSVISAALGAFYGIAIIVFPTLVLVLMRSRRDVTTILIFTTSVLLLWPAPLRIQALGAAGTPAVIGGGVALLAWIRVRMRQQGSYALVVQPVRWACYFVALSAVSSFVAAYVRRPDSIELRSADRGLIIILVGVGLAILACDGIQNMERLKALVRAISVCGALVALIGIVQFVTGLDLAGSVSVPGFSRNVSDWSAERSGFSRIMSTSDHPIELSVVLAMILPLAIYTAMTTTEPTRRRFGWLCVALIGFGLPMTVSRTSALGGAVAIIFSCSAWTKRQRRLALIGAMPAAIVMKVLFPGLLGTIRALFTSAGEDPSVSARESDYSIVLQHLSERPVTGRGFATFLPTRYLYLDNQYLLSLVETGILGLLALLCFFGVGLAVARGARRYLGTNADGALAQALLASIAVAAVTSVAYDSWTFSTGRGLTFVVIGCAGALWRFARFPEVPEVSPQNVTGDVAVIGGPPTVAIRPIRSMQGLS